MLRLRRSGNLFSMQGGEVPGWRPMPGMLSDRVLEVLFPLDLLKLCGSQCHSGEWQMHLCR